MPKYKVIEEGFYNGKIYKPDGKRSFLHTDKPLKPVPSWVEVMKAETAAQKKKRVAAEKKADAAAKKKAESDKKDVDDLTFMGDGKDAGSMKPSNVETL